MQIRPIDNFALSKVIIPQLIEKLKVKKVDLYKISFINLLQNIINPNVPLTFDWSELSISAIKIDRHRSIIFIIFPQPLKMAQCKYGLILEDERNEIRLEYFTLEDSFKISLSDCPCDKAWHICTINSNGTHRNYGALEGLPTPYNFFNKVISLNGWSIKPSRSFTEKLLGLNKSIEFTSPTNRQSLCVISDLAQSKIDVVKKQLLEKQVNVGIMLGHIFDNNIVLIMDCFFVGPRSIDIGFDFEYELLNQKANDISRSYKIPLSFIGYIHSQPDDYLSNQDEISTFDMVAETSNNAYLGILSTNGNCRIYEMFKHSLINDTNISLMDYVSMNLNIGDDLIPDNYLIRKML